jgi:hypothetical protein
MPESARSRTGATTPTKAHNPPTLAHDAARPRVVRKAAPSAAGTTRNDNAGVRG